ncbi:hypothetical protein [Microvirga sp. VF16]|uniref:hypothetical protein n=1 Tax=Microvirga sp. VF16 TaxID=2807101 RepID=UPI00193DADB7|nr:hypothetical protein [Microvirga sp. VF16]QRM28650.1 hypothetical protein JO965_20835 [Microvirga sp. VF16]
MVYLYWLGAFIVVTPLILGLPFLSQNGLYRVATLFAGMNTGIITLSHFINLLRYGSGPTYVDELHAYFIHIFPGIYIASLIVGSTLVFRYYLNASTRSGTILSTLGSLLGSYVLSIAVIRLLEIFFITIEDGFPSLDHLHDILSYFISFLVNPGLSSAALFFVSALIALNGTAAAMRVADGAVSPTGEETE